MSHVTFDASYSYGSYEGPLRNLIHLFKYGKVESVAAPLSRFLLQALPIDSRFDLVIPMPMHWRKRWERGFNQAELLAKPLAKARRIPLSKELRRTRLTKAQAGLSGEKREKNIKNSFRVVHAPAIAGKRILLIDDVMTTGATLRAAAEALKQAGASHVGALTLARVERQRFDTSSKIFSKAQGARKLRAAAGSETHSLGLRSVYDGQSEPTS